MLPAFHFDAGSLYWAAVEGVRGDFLPSILSQSRTAGSPAPPLARVSSIQKNETHHRCIFAKMFYAFCIACTSRLNSGDWTSLHPPFLYPIWRPRARRSTKPAIRGCERALNQPAFRTALGSSDCTDLATPLD